MALIKEKYLINSRKFHPDFHASADNLTQQEMLEKSTLNNEAFMTLKDESLRIPYLLGILRHGAEEEQPNLPFEFLMQMMELNEAIADNDGDEESLNEISKRLSEMESGLNEELTHAMHLFDNARLEGDRQNILDSVQQAYLKFKYLLRIRESLNKFVN